jgi:hypothetical protein
MAKPPTSIPPTKASNTALIIQNGTFLTAPTYATEPQHLPARLMSPQNNSGYRPFVIPRTSPASCQRPNWPNHSRQARHAGRQVVPSSPPRCHLINCNTVHLSSNPAQLGSSAQPRMRAMSSQEEARRCESCCERSDGGGLLDKPGSSARESFFVSASLEPWRRRPCRRSATWSAMARPRGPATRGASGTWTSGSTSPWARKPTTSGPCSSARYLHIPLHTSFRSCQRSGSPPPCSRLSRCRQ